MILNIKATQVELTPALKEYVEHKIGSLDRFLKRWEQEGELEAWIEVGRTSRHHHKGYVFRAEVTIRMPQKKVLRADEESMDVRTAVDMVRDKVFKEIKKYGDRKGSRRRPGRSKE